MKNLKTTLRCNKLFIIAFIFIIFYVLILTKLIKYHSAYDLKESSLSGTITGFSTNGNKVTLEIKGKEKIIVYYYLNSLEEKAQIFSAIHLGDKITLSGTFKKPINNTIPNTFNYKEYLYNQKIYLTFQADSYQVESGANVFYQIKDFLLKRAYNLENSDYFLVFLLGDKTLLSSEDILKYQLNGTSHLLAISGMHIGIIIAIISKLLKKINHKASFLLTSLVLIFFAFITSFAASVLRAVLFFILNQLNKIFNLRLNNIQILFVTAFFILLFDPFMIYDLGFVYSFVICAGIMYYQDKLNGNYLKSLLKLSVITFLFSLPITVLLNYEINLISIFTNLIFVPLISLFVYPLSLITFVFPVLTPIFSFGINITNYLNNFFYHISIMINIPKFPFPFLFLFYFVLIISKRKSKHFMIYFLLIIIIKLGPIFDNKYYNYYMDVGQGDCSILISPHQREIVMIDTGGKMEYQKEEWKASTKSYNISDNIIKFLKSRGITSIDYLVISHGDADHAGEAINIINHLKIKNVVLNNGTKNKLEKKIAIISNITNHYQLENFQITNLNQIDYNDENQNSIINYITFKKYHFLFMGDASIKQEEKIINSFTIPKIDIIKLGHHGSNTSTGESLLNNIDFNLAIISSGRNNRYHHPHQDIIKKLEDNNKSYLNTQTSGTIEVIFSENDYTIKTYSP